jgi:hypothetical protein
MARERLQSERARTVAEPRIKTPTLVILLGSTPAKAGLELSRHLLTLAPGDRRKVAQVYIDTDEKPGPQIEFQHEHAGLLQLYDLHIAVPAGISHSTQIPVDRELQTFIDIGPVDRPPNEPPKLKVPQYFANGAGGIRNNGHVAAAYNHQRIVQTLESALGALERLGHDQGERQLIEIQVNIVAFLGGGTGSGVLPDMAVMLRELLTTRQFLQRINLFCMLPEYIRGATVNDISWRKSNAVACLLEMLALSHVAGARGNVYTKWMLNNAYHVTDDPVANEVYLIGRTSMGSDEDTARIVGLDLFQRISDASGVGALEHSTWVNRRTLGATDDRGLFTMFGTSCPLEVRFPAEETAAAFAQISASYLLPLLINFVPETPTAEDGDRLRWRQEWTQVSRFTEATADDPLAVQPQPEFGEDEFFGASGDSLDILWDRLKRSNKAIEEQIERAVIYKRREEEREITTTPAPRDATDRSPLARQIRQLRLLEQEYAYILDLLRANPVEEVASRPREQEAKLVQPFRFPVPSMIEEPAVRGHARKVAAEYNYILETHRQAVRYNKLVSLTTDLLKQVQAQIGQALAWLRDTSTGRSADHLRSTGLLSSAWQGRLDPPHPHMRHIFDLHTLRRVDEGNVAVEKLFWAVTVNRDANGGSVDFDQLVGFGRPLEINKFAGHGKPLDFNAFAGPCISYLSQHMSASSDTAIEGSETAAQLASQRAGGLADRVVEYFKDYYMSKFEDLNLFELLSICAVDRSKPEPAQRQVSRYLQEHLDHIRGLMRNLIAFEAELWHDGPLRLDTTLYLGMHVRRQTGQQSILDAALSDLGALNERNDTPRTEHSFDPHRLQVSYGQHGISIATIPDFYKESNSAMGAYLQHQAEWFGDGGRGRGANKMPVLTNGELERLVNGSGQIFPSANLPRLVMRRSLTQNIPNGYYPAGQGVAAGPAAGGGASSAPPFASPDPGGYGGGYNGNSNGGYGSGGSGGLGGIPGRSRQGGTP